MRAVVVAVLVVPLLAGCLQPYKDYHEFDIDDQYENPAVFPGQYRMGAGGSMVLESGLLVQKPFPEVVRLKSDLPAFFGPLSDTEEAEVDIPMAIWRPNTTARVPIIVDAGPYFENSVHCRYGNQDPCQEWVDDTIDWPGQTTPFSLSNYISHGYAVVQLAVRGTGTAGGCMDLMGPAEQHDLNQALTWLGEQPWSNGRIGMIGASYDGSTPWLAAAAGNPYLKAIVPTAGLPDIYSLMWRNGTAEHRGPYMHNVVYYGYGYDDDFPQRPQEWPDEVPWLPPAGVGGANGRTMWQDMHHALCPEVVEGTAAGQYSYSAGDRGDPATTYWTERDYRQRVIDNYDGGIFLVHGFQDWNVDPHSAIPFNKELRKAGKDMLEWYGQWGHAFPDSECAPAAPDWAVLPCRMDFAEVLLRFYERHLKGDMDVELPPPVQLQDNTGYWRYTDVYPNDAATSWFEMKLSYDGTITTGDAVEGTIPLPPSGPSTPLGAPQFDGPGMAAKFVSEPFDEDTVISGLPQLKLPFDVEGQGGQIAVWMFDEDPRGLVRASGIGYDPQAREWFPAGFPFFGNTQMNARYYAGGEEPRELVPGQVYEAQLEMDPLEVRIPAGNKLAVWVMQYHIPDKASTTTQANINIHVGDDARLRLPVVDLDPKTVFPVPGAHFRNASYAPEMYIPYPNIPAFSPVYAAEADVARTDDAVIRLEI